MRQTLDGVSKLNAKKDSRTKVLSSTSRISPVSRSTHLVYLRFNIDFIYGVMISSCNCKKKEFCDLTTPTTTIVPLVGGVVVGDPFAPRYA